MNINISNIESKINFLISDLAKVVYEQNFKKIILGLSGGIDSAVSLCLAVEALGRENVVAICMPYKNSNPDSLKDALDLIKEKQIVSETINITDSIDNYFSKYPDASLLRKGNKMARERMSILYDLSTVHDALVLGTSNKTEILLGYGTIFGDTASAINPIGSLFKTEVRLLAAYLKVPKSIITKKPSADLWQGQTDEQELGWPYKELDEVLYLKFDKNLSDIELVKEGFKEDLIHFINYRYNINSYKRKMPTILKLR